MTGTTPLGNKILVTGAASGLGKYIAANIDCVALPGTMPNLFSTDTSIQDLI